MTVPMFMSTKQVPMKINKMQFNILMLASVYMSFCQNSS